MSENNQRRIESLFSNLSHNVSERERIVQEKEQMINELDRDSYPFVMNLPSALIPKQRERKRYSRFIGSITYRPRS